MPSVLERVANAGISIATRTPQIERDQQEANLRISQGQGDAIEANNAANEAAARQQAEMQQLARAAFDPNNPDADRALDEIFVRNPDFGKKFAEAIGVKNQNELESVARRADQVFRTPFAQRRAVLLSMAADIESKPGGDASHTLSLLDMNEQEQNNQLRIAMRAPLSAKDRLANERGTDVPAGIQEHEALLAAANGPEGTARDAARVKLGLDPRATGSAAQTIAAEGTTELVAASEARIREAGKFAEATGASRARMIDEGFTSIKKIDANIRNLDQVVDALDNGASTGAIVSRFTPTIRAATVELEQLQAQLGLDVVGSVQFGALSEGELNLAMMTALPDKLPPAELREWVLRRQAAQTKLRAYISEQIDFLDQGGTPAGFLRKQSRKQIADAVAAIEAGADPVEVQKRLSKMGLELPSGE